MDSDEKLEISTKRKAKKEQVQKRIARKMISLEESARKKQTEDDVCGVSLRSKGALEQDPHKVATDVEQGIVTEALRHRVRGKLKTIKTEQEEFFSENQDVPTEGYPNNPEVNVEEAPVDEGLAFFTSTFEDHSKLEEVDPSVDQKSINNGLQNVCDLNEQTPLLHHVKEILPELLEVKPAEFEDNNLNKEKQCDYLFVPSIFPVIHRSKLLKNMLPRNLEDEGFYIPRKPYISRNTYHKMENRLLQEEGGKDWFEENGELISLPSPIKQSHNYRVSFPNETDIQLRTTYRKAMNPELEKCIIAKPGEENKIYQLDLNISSIVFSHHSLFNCEQVLASRLLDIYECFQKRQRQNVTHLLSEKLRALTSATKLSESNLKINQLSTSTLKDFRSQIRHTKRLYDKECQRDSSLIQNMLKIWKQIKSVRKKQGFISTTVKLQFQRLANNSEMDSCDVKISEEDDKVGCLDSSHILQTETDFGGWNEPLFIPHLTFVTEITTANLCPIDEQKRRDKVNLKSYFIKIYYNSKLVSSTLEAPLCQDFKVIFQQMFRIQVLNWPESLCLEIFESSRKPSLLARVYLPVPSNIILKSKDILDEVEFSCEQQVKPLDRAVGSNIPFYLDENETDELCILTSGKVIYSLFWTVDDKGIPLAPFQPAGSSSMSGNIRLGKGTGIWWHSDIKKCIDWVKEVNIDPNDPDYTDLLELIMYAKSQEQSDSKYFRLEQLQEEFNFATTEDIKNCKRFQLLQLRSLGQLDYYCFQQIPLYDREIPDTVFQQYGSQLEKDMLMTDVDPISAQRNSSISFISMMRKQIRKRIVTIWHKYNLSDIVNDYEEIISMSQLSDAIFKLGERRRHLKPQRKERRKVPAQAISDGDVKLLIRILRAYNIPTRKVLEIKGAVAHSSSYLLNRMSRGRHVFSGNSAFTVDLLSEVSVHPFVEITFQNTVYQTSTADGSHPCWNEELQVDFTSPGHDYTFIGLSKIKEDININIFDEFVIEKHEDACPKSCSGHSYVRKNWLGSVTFPFSALLEQSKICGTFQVNTPPVLLGYTWSKTYVPPIEDCYRQNLKEYTFLTIFATIEPQLSSAENNLESDKLVDHEDETLLQRANIFKQACKMMFPKRRIITSVFDNQGRNILVTKYITPLNPPQVLLDMCPDDPNSASDFVSRFVSLIPCISDTVDENDDVDIWMTSEHCIKWGVCNKEEHAVLLCNYLLYIGKKAWVLLGTSVLEGKVAYVAAQENGYFFLWNPLSSQCYKQFDAFCPLQSVDCLINCENPEKILYIPTDESLVEELQNRIEKALKNKMMEWRSQHPTRWHRQCTSVLRQILPKLEFRNGDTAKEKEENYLETFHEHYWVTGFPIQMLYLDVQSITEAVYQTGIHSSEIPNTEFALAVYIHPYPNNMLSVWIYLVSLVRHQ
ncbi:protein CC2D2B isoform X3 [Sceloporus undulatus]|uniref:protein CC2D2B isoform X3 n=1 Tax=Sceloporus undulatus TaxID=8520 RepID=UPI001C4A9416|nr:protein CC2D2B isoform X3 [Sceloporus undulatus]